MRIQEQPLRILEFLLEQPGELVSRERLRERLWPSDTFVDFERSLNAAVAKLRQALHDSADRPVYIETVARKGYRFIAPVTETAAGPNPAQTASGWSRRRASLLARGAVLCAGAVIFAWIEFRGKAPPQQSDAMRFTVAMPAGTQLAGAPFEPNMAISPNGRTLALVVSPPGGVPSIWLRPLESEDARHLDGTGELLSLFGRQTAERSVILPAANSNVSGHRMGRSAFCAIKSNLALAQIGGEVA